MAPSSVSPPKPSLDWWGRGGPCFAKALDVSPWPWGASGVTKTGCLSRWKTGADELRWPQISNRLSFVQWSKQYWAAHHLMHLNWFLRLGNLHHAVGAHIGCICCGHFAAPAVGEDLRKMMKNGSDQDYWVRTEGKLPWTYGSALRTSEMWNWSGCHKETKYQNFPIECAEVTHSHLHGKVGLHQIAFSHMSLNSQLWGKE